jgi:hypothetical protein
LGGQGKGRRSDSYRAGDGIGDCRAEFQKARACGPDRNSSSIARGFSSSCRFPIARRVPGARRFSIVCGTHGTCRFSGACGIPVTCRLSGARGIPVTSPETDGATCGQSMIPLNQNELCAIFQTR